MSHLKKVLEQKDKEFKNLKDDKFSLLLDIIEQKKALFEKFKILKDENPSKLKKAEDYEKSEIEKKKKEDAKAFEKINENISKLDEKTQQKAAKAKESTDKDL